MKKIILFALIAFGFSFHSFAQSPTWLRYPSISPDGKTIVFTYKGDLYKVASAGGSATPLTLHEAHDFMPVWSKDSKSIAFASDRYGNFDVFVIPVEGGEAKRLTYHSSAEYPYSFTNDNKAVVFGGTRMDLQTNRQFPSGYMTELYSVAVNGGRVSQLFTTPAEDVKFSKDGSKLIYQNKVGGENIWRKHHTSAVTRDIVLYDFKTNTHKQITSFNGEDRSPVFTTDESGFYYLSEESGSYNIHKMNLSGGKSEKLTSYKKHPVRFLTSSNDGLLSYGYDGEIYTMKPGASAQKVNITILSDARNNKEQVYRVSTGSGMSLSPNGKEIAFLYRGEVFVTSVDGGITKRITNTPEAENSVNFSPDGKSILYCSERDGKWSVYETRMERKEEPYFYASTILIETAVLENKNTNTQPVYSPDGKEIAYIENRNQLRIYNIASKQSRTLLNGDYLFAWTENDQYFQWSPDSKWLLFDYAMPGSAVGEVGLVSLDGKKIVNLTESGFNDSRPKWINGGKAMLWFSNRDGLRGAAMSGGAQSDAYALFFTQDAFDRFKLSKEDAALLKETEETKAKADTTKKKAPAKDSVVIDWDGLTQRKTKLTIHSSSMGDALISKDGETLYYLARFERGMNLWTTNLRTRETKMLVPLNAGFANMVWDKEQKNIFLNTDGGFAKIDPNSGKQDRISINGEMIVDGLKERQYQFDHVWRRTKNTFYTQSFHGIDWDSYKPDYEKHLPGIGNNYEMSELLSELLGELNVSHSGAAYGGAGNPNADATSALGIFYDVNFKGNGIKILEVIKDGPLDKAGMNVKAGTIIESIDGEMISPDKDIAQYLNRKAGKNTLVVLVEGSTKRELIVKPISIGEESRLLYARWVKRNADEVDKMSNGTLGYVHIPGMNDGAFRTTYEEIMGKHFQKKGIVVDTRNNGGGDLVADLAMFLSGKKFMDYATDTRSNGFEPNFRWTKPSISLANEGNYSDGHCYAYMVKEVGIGKLVGMPVPGTCSFAAWESLMDTGIRWGAPTVGCKDSNGKYLENAQTEPDIKVKPENEKVSMGNDQQLETAVKELMKETK
ncbi:S41 family peptidase [Lacibacter sediminis]|uniref:Tricorn protease homolog n=1 Tax=Lacibacter sediminis TaxID=2760713 RepID=A0A7G5XFA8_9BACT|nr:S41 family peptidase [Lacibacter sediminis]QNA44161.1 PD40 domain-containing protein [Lacibacter sediminis]